MLSLLFVMWVSAGLINFLELRSDGGNVSTLHVRCKVQMKLKIFIFHRATWLMSGDTHLAEVGKTVKELVSNCH